MIRQNPDAESEVDAASAAPPFRVVLARYGAVPQVARFGVSESLFHTTGSDWKHGMEVVVQSDRGPELGHLLEVVHDGVNPQEKPVTGDVLRIATADDRRQHATHRQQADVDFFDWQTRIEEWQLQLQIIDMERTLDGEQLILYVLNGQDAESTRLALLAAAAGLGIVTVQPVASEGVVQTTGGGCGSGGCGSGGCSN